MSISHDNKLNFNHYLIIFGCLLLQAIPFSLAQNIPPLFIHYLHIDFQFSLANIGLIFTVGAAAASISSPFIGKLFNTLSTKILMISGLIISSIGIFLNSIATHLGMFLFDAAIIQIGCIIYSGLGVPYLIGTWFDEKHKATALGFAFAGGSIGNFFLQPIFTHLLEKYANHSVHGLHNIYLFASIFSLLIGLFILIFMIHDNKQVNTTNHHTSKSLKLSGVSSKTVCSLPEFWILFLGMFFIGLNISAQSAQYANYFENLNLPISTVGIIGSVFALSCLVGNLSGGVLFSKIGIFKTSLAAFIFQMLSCLMMIILSFIHMEILGFLWAIFYGITVFIYTSGPATIIQDLFGMRYSSEILGIFSISFAVGFAIGNVILGMIIDKFGYLSAWGFNFTFIVIGYLLLLISMKKLMLKNYAQEA